MTYAVFFSGSLGDQLKTHHKGYYVRYSRFRGACAVNVRDPRALELWDGVEKRAVKLRPEKVKWATASRLAKREYPKGTLIWGAANDVNPYIIFVPMPSFESAVYAVKNGKINCSENFTIGDYIAEAKAEGRWSQHHEKKYAALYGTKWMEASELPPVSITYINGGNEFPTMEAAKESQDARWEHKPEGAPGDWNTILTKNEFII